MKFKGKFDAEDSTMADSRINSATYYMAGGRKKRVDDDIDIDDDYFDGGDSDDDGDLDADTASLLDQFDDEIEGVDLSDLDLDDFAGEFDNEDLDDDIDGYDDYVDDAPRGSSKRHHADDEDIVDDDDIDDSAFYNDDFKDFDNYTTVSDFDDDLDSYIENENGGYYDDYDSRY